MEIYAEIVNLCYELPKIHQVTVKKLEQDTSTTRVVKKVGSLFRRMPDTIRTYDHFMPADWLLRNPDFLDKKSAAIDSTLQRAEEIMKTYNGLLD